MINGTQPMKPESCHEALAALRDKLADVMLTALREQAGFPLTHDEWDRLHKEVANALRGHVQL